ncbi:hypothetical protein FOZ63_018927 [Perkinsus olseni]|uniref:PX domain-containing protein n=2 Tax=Perkinsus olseni TaxID=32597 RepID=A0A7J6SPH0_PEROL|nr:hypothetical protein FOZ63_018927 [Perkinsus olseni]
MSNAPSQSPSNPTMKVRISDVTAAGEGLAQVVIYHVDSSVLRDGEVQDFHLMRKFPDFLWLREALVRDFPDRIVPPLPGRRVVSSFAASEVEGMRRLLELFLLRLAADEGFSAHLPFSIFLTYSWENLCEFKAAYGSTTPIATYAEDADTPLRGLLESVVGSFRRGANRAWLSLGLRTADEDGTGEEGTSSAEIDLAREVTDLEGRVAGLAASWWSIRACLRRYGDAVDELGRQAEVHSEGLKAASRRIRMVDAADANLLEYRVDDLRMYLQVCLATLSRQACMASGLRLAEAASREQTRELARMVDRLNEAEDEGEVSELTEGIRKLDRSLRDAQSRIQGKREALERATQSLRDELPGFLQDRLDECRRFEEEMVDIQRRVGGFLAFPSEGGPDEAT